MAPLLLVDDPDHGLSMAMPIAVAREHHESHGAERLRHIASTSSDIGGIRLPVDLDGGTVVWIWVVSLEDAAAEDLARWMLEDARSVANVILALPHMNEWLVGAAPDDLRAVLEASFAIAAGTGEFGVESLATALLRSPHFGQLPLPKVSEDHRARKTPVVPDPGMYEIIRDAMGRDDPVFRLCELIADELESSRTPIVDSPVKPRGSGATTQIKPGEAIAKWNPALVHSADESAAHIRCADGRHVFAVIREEVSVDDFLRLVANALSIGQFADHRLIQIGFPCHPAVVARLVKSVEEHILVAIEALDALSADDPTWRDSIERACDEAGVPSFSLVRTIRERPAPSAEGRATVVVTVGHFSDDPWVVLAADIADSVASAHQVTFSEEAIIRASDELPAANLGDEFWPASLTAREHGTATARRQTIVARLELAASRASARNPRAVIANDIALDPWDATPAPDTGQEALTAPSLFEALRSEILGQDAALQAVSRRIWVGSSRFRINRERPEAVLLLAGPSGSGKTATAQAIARTRFGDAERVIRVDLRNYFDDHTSATPVGSPPGYLGRSDPEAWLTSRLASMGHVFDEIEKADHAWRKVLLELLETGRLADLAGFTADARKFVIVITSRVGSHKFTGNQLGFNTDDVQQTDLSKLVRTELDREFAPEFLNRIDDIVVFPALPRPDLIDLCVRCVSQLSEQVRVRGYQLTVQDDVIAHLVDTSDTSRFGARPLQRAVDEYLGAPLSELSPGHWRAVVTDDSIVLVTSHDIPDNLDVSVVTGRFVLGSPARSPVS